MPAPIPVHQQFTDEEKQEIARLFHEGKTKEQIGQAFNKPYRTIGKVLKHLGLKRTTSQTASLVIKSDLDSPEIVDKIRRLRPTHSLREIVEQVGGSIASVDRICRKYGINVPSEQSLLQSERMKKAWTGEKRQKASEVAKEAVTPELRKKLSDGSKKLWQDPEYRENQVRIQKFVWADITLRTKMSEILTGYWDNQERRDAMAAIQQLVWNDEKRAEMSKIQKEIWSDPAKRQRIAEVARIIWADPAMRLADSARLKKIWTNLELRAEDSERAKILWQDVEYREKTHSGLMDAMADEGVRQRLSDSSKKRWENPEYREHMAKVREAQPRVSSIQTTLYSILDDLNIKHYREYPDKPADPECTIGPYNFDCVIPRTGTRSLAIECHGDYWHSLDKSIRVDRSKATYLQRYHSQTHELKYIWEHEFACKDRVIELIKYWNNLQILEVVDFQFSDIQLRTPTATEYRLLLSKYHYLANAGRSGIVTGAYLGDQLVAVCIFSKLLRQNIDTAGYNSNEAVELSRLCINPRYQKYNFASWFVSRCLKALDKKYRLIISYCDTTFNHDGATYKALNFTQDKIVRSDYWYVSSDGWVMHKKTLYSRAVRLSMTEAAYAEQFGYKKVYGTEKLRFVLER